MVRSPLFRRASSFLWELRLGVHTNGRVGPPAEGCGAYSSIRYDDLHRILRSLQMGKDDVFVDIGCGKGRALACAALLPLSRVVGIELSPELCKIARHNAAAHRRRSAPIEIVEGPAESYGYDDATVVYMFNPFGREITKTVVERLKESWQRRPRPLRIVYVFPAHEEVLQHSGWIERYLLWQHQCDHPVSFWRAKATV